MGWRDRDWARFNDSERSVLYRSTHHYGPSRPVTWSLALAIGVSASLYVVGHYPAGHPLVPALRFQIPLQTHAHRHLKLGGPTSAPPGSRYTLSGVIKSAGGEQAIRLLGSWNKEPWRLLAIAPVAGDGSFHVTVRLDRLGILQLRLEYPNGDTAAGSVRVA